MDIQSISISQTGAVPGVVKNFTITENAARQIELLAQDEAPGAFLRISVNGGGCSGFQYDYSFGTVVNPDDQVFERDGAKVVIDELSLGFIAGSELDYIETLGSAEFQIRNPQATATCGCGNSFAV